MGKPTASRGSSSLPEGVEVREGKRGSSLRVTFTFLGLRRRETLDIPATPSNIKYAGNLVGSIKTAIEKGVFNYAAQFPNSKFAKHAAGPTQRRYLVTERVEAYIDSARKTKSQSPASVATYVKWNRSRIAPHFVDKYLDELTTPDCKEWIVTLASELAPKSVRNCVGVLSSVLNEAVQDGILAISPLKPIKLKTLLPKPKKQSEEDKVDPFNEDEIKAILDGANRIHERALFMFAFATGMRTGELIALKWRHIDWINGLIHVEDNVVSGEKGTVEKTTKTDEERDIPMLPSARSALEIMKPITAMLRNGDYIFTPDGINRWRNDFQIRSRWTIALKLGKVRYRNPYQTRHTFASTLLMNGEPELLVAKLLGHSTVEMIRKHYGKYIKPKGGIKLLSDYPKFGAGVGQSVLNKAA